MEYTNTMELEKPDFYIKHKKNFLNFIIVSGILFAIFLILTIIFGIKLNDVHADYEKVTVTITSASHSRKFGNKVHVDYNNEDYSLINVTDNEFIQYKYRCQDGKPVEVLLASDGKLYSNTDGIKTNTTTGKIYFVFLAGTFIFFIAFILLIGCVVEANKREKGIYPKQLS